MDSWKVNLGFVKNMGNYESARIEIGYESDQNSGETLDELKARVYNEVEAELIARLRELVEEIKEVGR